MEEKTTTEVMGTTEEATESTKESPYVVNVETTDYTEQLNEIIELLQAGKDLQVEQYEGYTEQVSATQTEMQATREYTEYLAGFGLVAIIIVLCRYVYKFFRIFF